MTRQTSRRDRIWSALGVQTPFDPNATFVTSPFVTPAVLAAIRLLLAFYSLTTICVVLGFQVNKFHTSDAFLSFFTELSYIGLCTYFFASGVQTLVYAVSGGQSYPLERWPRPLQFLHSLLYSTIITFPFIVTIVFWTILSDNSFATTFSGWSNISQHALNTPFALLELLLSSAGPQPFTHLPFLILLLALYLALAYTTHATQGFYVYDFLDPVHGGKVAGYVFGIAVAAIIIFSLGKGIQMWRNRLLGRRRRRDGLRNNAQRTAEALDEWETVEMDTDRPTRRIVLKTSREKDLGLGGRDSVGGRELGDVSVETDVSEKNHGVGRSPISDRNSV